MVLREGSNAYAWKTAYDEEYHAYSPGTLLMLDATTKLLDDPNITKADSLAPHDHPVMSRMWKEREPMVTLVVGLTPGSDRAARQAASQMDLYKKSQGLARIVRDRLYSLAGR